MTYSALFCSVVNYLIDLTSLQYEVSQSHACSELAAACSHQPPAAHRQAEQSCCSAGRQDLLVFTFIYDCNTEIFSVGRFAYNGASAVFLLVSGSDSDTHF